MCCAEDSLKSIMALQRVNKSFQATFRYNEHRLSGTVLRTELGHRAKMALASAFLVSYAAGYPPETALCGSEIEDALTATIEEALGTLMKTYKDELVNTQTPYLIKDSLGDEPSRELLRLTFRADDLVQEAIESAAFKYMEWMCSDDEGGYD